jgi:hypothetical protein
MLKILDILMELVFTPRRVSIQKIPQSFGRVLKKFGRVFGQSSLIERENMQESFRKMFGWAA